MDVVKEIIQNSALGPFSNGFKGLILSLFASIVGVLLTMLVVLITYGPEMSIRYGY
ncbi:hypothetical protein [Flagellimonas hymeniacidonis]|uniref:hypothetical protein n=1 Tax=Flagellimonas hymeniacidonis TaxID=2603628 RepID=UPI0016509706|nr:hypothetical protein [Flagellimonas hymeniacidonis]